MKKAYFRIKGVFCKNPTISCSYHFNCKRCIFILCILKLSLILSHHMLFVLGLVLFFFCSKFKVFESLK